MAKEGVQTGIISVDLSLPIPREWTEVGQVDKIFVYPMKSARGQLVDSAQVKSGPQITLLCYVMLCYSHL